jgi:hypothetical protein
MSGKLKLTTTVSSKGQVILPKAIRDQRQWPAGTDRRRYPGRRIVEGPTRLRTHASKGRLWFRRL